MSDYSAIKKVLRDALGLDDVKPKAEYGAPSPELQKQMDSGGLTGATLRAAAPMQWDENSAFAKWTKQPIGTRMSEEVLHELLNGPVMGTFAGINAKTADLAKLATAKELAAKGADNEAVRQATGWFKGMDDKWRFEIPDNAAEFKTKISKSKGFNTGFGDWRGPSGTRGDLGQALTHEELFAAYPDLASLYIDTPFGVTAQKSPSGQYYQKQTFFPEKIEVNSKLMSDKQKSMEALLHEVEHAVQAREGFTPGGSIRGMSMKDYRNLAGEIEARDVSARMNLTPEQRLATPPDLRPDAIVRYGLESALARKK